MYIVAHPSATDGSRSHLCRLETFLLRFFSSNVPEESKWPMRIGLHRIERSPIWKCSQVPLIFVSRLSQCWFTESSSYRYWRSSDDGRERVGNHLAIDLHWPSFVNRREYPFSHSWHSISRNTETIINESSRWRNLLEYWCHISSSDCNHCRERRHRFSHVYSIEHNTLWRCCFRSSSNNL